MIKKTSFVLFLAFVFLTGTAHAKESEIKAGIVPGNLFYILDVISEGVGAMFTFGDLSKAERHLELASERLAEASELVNKGKSDKALKSVSKYKDRLANALDKIEEAKEEDKDIETIMEKVADATSKHQEVLTRVFAKVPEQAKEAIKNAMERSQNGYETATRAVADKKQNIPDKNATSTNNDDKSNASSTNATSTKPKLNENKSKNTGRTE